VLGFISQVDISHICFYIAVAQDMLDGEQVASI
jgi:hypothetical protein